jgi:hypothetical protein
MRWVSSLDHSRPRGAVGRVRIRTVLMAEAALTCCPVPDPAALTGGVSVVTLQGASKLARLFFVPQSYFLDFRRCGGCPHFDFSWKSGQF